MKIEYFGHSCFKLTDSTNVSVVCDPFSGEIGYLMPEISANAITISHRHFDHDCTKNVAGSPSIFDKAGTFNVKGVQISSIKSFHDDVQGKKRGENLIFKFTMDGITVCHLGDLGESCSDSLIEKILPVNVLSIPVGGNYTIDAETAKEYVEKLNPQIVIPMHYRTDDCKIDIEKVDEFLKLFDESCICETDSLDLSKEQFNDNNTKITVIRRAR